MEATRALLRRQKTHGFVRPGQPQPEMKETRECPTASWAGADWAIRPQHLFMELILHVLLPFPSADKKQR